MHALVCLWAVFVGPITGRTRRRHRSGGGFFFLLEQCYFFGADCDVLLPVTGWDRNPFARLTVCCGDGGSRHSDLCLFRMAVLGTVIGRRFCGSGAAAFRPGHEPIRLRTASIAGLVLGLATVVRPTNVLAIPVFAGAVLVRDGKPALRAVFALCATSAIGVLALLAHNALFFGGPFQFGYPAAAEGASA